MAHKVVEVVGNRAHYAAKDAHKIVKVAANMTHIASHSCTFYHNEMKNNFHIKII